MDSKNEWKSSKKSVLTKILFKISKYTSLFPAQEVSQLKITECLGSITGKQDISLAFVLLSSKALLVNTSGNTILCELNLALTCHGHFCVPFQTAK